MVPRPAASASPETCQIFTFSALPRPQSASQMAGALRVTSPPDFLSAAATRMGQLERVAVRLCPKLTRLEDRDDCFIFCVRDENLSPALGCSICSCIYTPLWGAPGVARHHISYTGALVPNILFRNHSLLWAKLLILGLLLKHITTHRYFIVN